MVQARLARKERSKAIIDATVDLFAREGFAGATTRKIAGAAGVSEGLVFKCFPTKDRLYRAILQSKIEEFEQLLPLDSTLSRLDDEAFFYRIASTAMKKVVEDDGFLRLFLRSALDGHDLARDFARARTDHVHAFITRRIRARLRSRANGRPAIDPALAARLFVGLIQSTMLSYSVFKDPKVTKVPIDKLARSLVRVFLDGVRS